MKYHILFSGEVVIEATSRQDAIGRAWIDKGIHDHTITSIRKLRA